MASTATYLLIPDSTVHAAPRSLLSLHPAATPQVQNLDTQVVLHQIKYTSKTRVLAFPLPLPAASGCTARRIRVEARMGEIGWVRVGAVRCGVGIVRRKKNAKLEPAGKVNNWMDQPRQKTIQYMRSLVFLRVAYIVSRSHKVKSSDRCEIKPSSGSGSGSP